MEEFYMVDGPAQGEIVEKKSRFIANVFPVDSEEQALEIIEKTKKKILANNNYDMTIDYCLMNIWDELHS